MLLDTRALLWVIDGGAELGARARAALAAGDDPCFSPVSVAEICIKQMTDRCSAGGSRRARSS